MDIDILFYDDLVIKSDVLEIPHPRASERRFVLLPLCDIAPGFIHPVLGMKISEFIEGAHGGLRLFGTLDDLSG